MQNLFMTRCPAVGKVGQREAFQTRASKFQRSKALRLLSVCLLLGGGTIGWAQEQQSQQAQKAQDPLLNLVNIMIEKGMITADEANRVRAEAEARTNNAEIKLPESKWKISSTIKSVELFGDLRLRYEYRSAEGPIGNEVTLQRYRAALRVGLRGEVLDDFYYGFRLDTAANPRSPWVTLGTSTSGVPYQGPFGKSTSTVFVGQIYAGWHPEDWFDLTVGRMPQPLYTTPMLWDTDLNPEGLAERFKYTVGIVDFFANFGQFLYQEIDPSSADGGLGFNGLTGQQTENIWLLAWQAGFNAHITPDISAKAAGTIYNYKGLQASSANSPNVTSPFYGDPYVGEGAFTGPNSAFPVNGASGFGTSTSFPGNSSLGFPVNQVGLDHLLVLDVPFEVNFNLKNVDLRLFGDVAYNLDGAARAEEAAQGYATYLANSTPPVTVVPFKPQRNDVKAYQFGFAVGSKDSLGLVYGNAPRKHAWEFRTYWQHIEQYALDPNLLDSDFFEGRANLEGIYAAAAYGFSDHMIGTVRYGYAKRINDKLGTGGSNQDIPQLNPINRYEIIQTDLTFKF